MTTKGAASQSIAHCSSSSHIQNIDRVSTRLTSFSDACDGAMVMSLLRSCNEACREFVGSSAADNYDAMLMSVIPVVDCRTLLSSPTIREHDGSYHQLSHAGGLVHVRRVSV